MSAITEHDHSTVVTPTQLADGLLWLRNELIKAVAPFAVRKDYETKANLARMFQLSLYAVERLITETRIRYKTTASGKTYYNTDDFESAYKSGGIVKRKA